MRCYQNLKEWNVNENVAELLDYYRNNQNLKEWNVNMFSFR